MAVRIYALAKELNLDSKVLVDICPKVGVQGKGSALASLSDEEVEKLRAFISNPAPSAPAPRSPEKPAVSEGSPIRTLPGSPRKRLAPTRPAPSPPPLAPQPPAVQGPVRPSFSPASNEGKLRTIGSATPQKPKDSDSGPSGDEGGKAPLGPVFRAAAMPASRQPSPAPKSNEPAPQKPDIKLPADAIRSAKAGSGALRAHVDKVEAKRKADLGKTPASRQADETSRGAMPSGRGRGRVAERGKADDPQKGAGSRPLSREDRKRKRQGRSGVVGPLGDSQDSTRSRPRRRQRRSGPTVNTAAPRKSAVVVALPCQVRSFSEAAGIPAVEVLRWLLQSGARATINSTLDLETAELLAEDLGVQLEFRQPVDLEEQLISEIESREAAPEELEWRPPVVTFLGHVDHGKTSLLDRIIGMKVVEGEAGGITQHIRAYRVEREGGDITFVDTPGHEAFTEMRARGANVTDIVVLVVAADDGVMPQTEEAISHARAAEVPIVVALNKIDLPGVDVNRAMQELAANDLLPSEWGGETEVVKCSAITGEGVDQLLETLETIAELHEFKASPHRNASGTCLEAQRNEGEGVVAKMLVQDGTQNVGDVVVCGAVSGRVKAMYDSMQPQLRCASASPATPVNLTGLNEVPQAGDKFYVLDDITQVREIASRRSDHSRETQLSAAPKAHTTLEGIFATLELDEVRTLNLILRADARGSIEAIEKELKKLDHPEVQVKLLQTTVGGVCEADVYLADASDAIIIAFNVVPNEGARALAKERGVEIRRYDIIYRVTEDLKLALEGMLKPEEHEKELGRALVQRVFTVGRSVVIAGCRVLAGTIRREQKVRVRVIRDSTVIGDYPLESLRREKDDAREVREGLECGIKLAGFNDIKEGDLLEAYKIEEVARTL